MDRLSVDFLGFGVTAEGIFAISAAVIIALAFMHRRTPKR